MRAVWPFPGKGGGSMSISETFELVFMSIGLTISGLALIVSMIVLADKKK